MNEYELKIKLPSTITVHIPTFAEMDIEQTMEVIYRSGTRFIKETVADLITQEFIKTNKSKIEKIVKDLTKTKQKEILESIKQRITNVK